ncbi:MAG: DUF1835 domain-containing protein [Winogradskyella sp.]|nr:DUF1835 domain-containing protein [Winogradskyella sp.]MBT8375859.1 DUF1835 domain-containing protein [Bacteroidia bacterium]NNC46380.1 DUF1835 domain-containing protein [Winogradskyella sp.]NNF85641.1 DUF1835 domain-containing protein [Winogradskyella sp.]NNL83106.1 DUF1835 domain-containing protein [Winogradskyella sp.]
MKEKLLHITNGNALTDFLKDLNIEGTILTWQEMLCEGPTISAIDSPEFFEIRKQFLKAYYDIEVNDNDLKSELSKLNNTDSYDQIILWFEYDLFCHINMLGVINLLHQKEINKPLYLVCSGRIKGEKNLKGLSELTPEQLLEHYNEKIELNTSDKELAISLWRTYCGKDHNIFKPYITQKSSFKYLSNCLKAHLERFPNQQNGLGKIEENILKIIEGQEIKSEHHLLGYCLNYQGFYGFGDLQLERIIKSLSLFYTTTETGIELTRKGHEALLGHHNFASEINNDMTYGGVDRLKFQFSTSLNKLVKTTLHVN